VYCLQFANSEHALYNALYINDKNKLIPRHLFFKLS